MVWYALLQIFSTLLRLWQLQRQSSLDKDLEILLLRRQLALYQRQVHGVMRPAKPDKFILAALTCQLRRHTNLSIQQLRRIITVVQPETVLKWHRQMVKRKWTQRPASGGRPRISKEVEALVLRLARENDWGCARIEGEIVKLGFEISDQSVANILERHGLLPTPQRQSSLTWQHLMTHYKEQLLACDFFTVDTLFLRRIYALFFIEIGTRRVHFAGCTPNPNATWVTQQARQFVWKLDEQSDSFRFLIHDRDTKFNPTFDAVFHSKQIKIIRTPPRAPKANAFAERWIRSVRHECLDKLIILNEHHLRRVMRIYVEYYNVERLHHGI